ncbi:putative Band 7 domain-containing protein [Rosa chinensis]|uniref:Putative Band 7 domain-containing protein n=1 Tax=Rosa chinensis TaxID=74649 RepID=A0A2P6SBB0_ROSCH|nr:uncharacterized protein LOC112181559 [Rosa chinensis]XP_040368811.1 uncharacterized protein LOC112181559 [Rosa chinensis]PRQ55980.1 putative Band 7 domain-containing protein [Rosa chinensis]
MQAAAVSEMPRKIWVFGCGPKDHAYVIEFIDQYWETLMPGESVFLFPWMGTIAHVQCSNEKQLIVPDHTVFTNDLCPVTISGLVSLKIEDVTRASYLPENPMATAIRFAQTAMRSAVGKVAYDKLHLETRYINNFILNELSIRFYLLGLRCLQFDIKLPQEVLEGMDIRAAVKRIKRIKGIDGVILDESQKEELHGLHQALSKNVEETSGTRAAA